MNFLTAFITGLTTGGLTCLAVQGGLLIGLLAKQQADGQGLVGWRRLVLPVSGFLVAKIVAYTLFGLALGAIGQKLQLSSTAQIWIQAIVAVFIIITGLRLIWPHWLPWLTISPPANVRRLVRRSARSQALAAPMFLGVLTVLIPCGTTIAIEAAALATGSPTQAAAILFGFTLGTAPLFFLLGIVAKGAAAWQTRLKYVTAILVVGLGIYSFNGVLNAIDSPFSFRNQIAAWGRALHGEAVAVEPETSPVIGVSGYGYSPENVTVPSATTVKLQFKPDGPLGCASVLRIPKLGIERVLSATQTSIVTVSFPKPGRYTFTCGMGMYSGTITAV